MHAGILGGGGGGAPTWLRRALRLGGALMAAVRDLLGEGLKAEQEQSQTGAASLLVKLV